MEEEINPSVIKATQQSLGKYVKRPPLSDKLLKKPPFRFLHDIVTSILKSKGFFEGLFDENELTSDNVKDRDSKINFLNKVISVVSLTTGESLSVKPSKIVAGQEPTKTNELLQSLARALDSNLSSDTAVKQFKTGEKISTSSDKKTKESLKTVKKNTELKKLTSKINEKLINNDKNTQNIKTKHKESIIHKKDSPPKRPASKVSNKKPSDKLKQEPALQNNIPLQEKNKRTDTKTNVSDEKLVNNTEQNTFNDENIAVDKNLSSDERTLQPDKNLHESLSSSFVSDQENQLGEVTINDSQILSNDNFVSTVKKSMLTEDEIRKTENINEGLLLKPVRDEMMANEDEHKKIMQEGNAGVNEDLKANFVENRLINVVTQDKNNSTAPVRPASVRPSSSRPGAPRIREKSDSMISDTENIVMGKVNIISETTLQEEDDEDTTIIVEDQTAGELQEMLQNQESNNPGNNQNSHLVQQILDSQKEYSQVSGKTEIEWQFGVQKTSDIFLQEMEQLKFNVQALSRIANPLGKLLDHIQEDVEVMRQELQQWMKLYEETSKDLIKQKTANEESLLPFHTKIKQLNMDISEKHEKITDLKISIHKNTARIEKLLASGNVQ